jgi:hypothetical protein
LEPSIDIAALQRKYEAIIRLRRAAEGVPDADHWASMVALSDEFPGALRETDELPMDHLEERWRELGDVLAENQEPAHWMKAMARFHTLTRGALSAKRWLAGRRVVDDEARRSFAVDLPTLRHPGDASLWADHLADLAAPTRGRITAVVFARMATEWGAKPQDLRSLVFPASVRVGKGKPR